MIIKYADELICSEIHARWHHYDLFLISTRCLHIPDHVAEHPDRLSNHSDRVSHLSYRYLYLSDWLSNIADRFSNRTGRHSDLADRLPDRSNRLANFLPSRPISRPVRPTFKAFKSMFMLYHKLSNLSDRLWNRSYRLSTSTKWSADARRRWISYVQTVIMRKYRDMSRIRTPSDTNHLQDVIKLAMVLSPLEIQCATSDTAYALYAFRQHIHIYLYTYMSKRLDR